MWQWKRHTEPSPGASAFSCFSHQEWAKVRLELDALQRLVCACVCICVCWVCNSTLADCSGEKDTLTAFLLPSPCGTKDAEAGAGSTLVTGCFMPNQELITFTPAGTCSHQGSTNTTLVCAVCFEPHTFQPHCSTVRTQSKQRAPL